MQKWRLEGAGRAALLCLLPLWACAQTSPGPGKVGGQGADPSKTVAACGFSPNCTSSGEPSGAFHHIEPFKVPAGMQDPMGQLKKAVLAQPGARIVSEKADRIKAEFVTPTLKFTDDGDFVYVPESGRIEVRSASRVGFSDLGTNRRRLEAIRAAFAK